MCHIALALRLALLAALTASCSATNDWADGDAEPDADADAEGGDDADADTDVDADGDGDTDSDVDSDADTGVDSDADGGPDPCAPIGGVAYETLTVSGPPMDRPAAVHGDINVRLREKRPASAVADLVDIDGPTDARAPKLFAVYADDAPRGIASVWQIQSWDWGCDCPSDFMTEPEVTLAGLPIGDGEVVETPRSGYDIGDGFTALVLFADDDTITLKYTREDNVVWGYTIHLSGLCVEPSLLALYRACDAAGRGELPALRGDQPLGRARGAEVYAAVRDTGSWMDPRARKDWW